MKNYKDHLKNQNINSIPKITQNDIKQYVLERFEEIKQGSSMEAIIKFHSHNKYLLMAHNQEKLKILGNIVANHQKRNIHEMVLDYENHLKMTLEKTPTVKTHINVLMHIFGFFGKYFNQIQKNGFLDLVKEYRENRITLGRILCLIEPITYQINTTYLVSQTYFLLYSESVINNFGEIGPQTFNIRKELHGYE